MKQFVFHLMDCPDAEINPIIIATEYQHFLSTGFVDDVVDPEVETELARLGYPVASMCDATYEFWTDPGLSIAQVEQILLSSPMFVKDANFDIFLASL